MSEYKKCVGCGRQSTHSCPQCGKPTCNRSIGLCGHTEGICAICVEERLLLLQNNTVIKGK